ncbi:ABC transporter permease [Labrys monachus]|uniref:Autoinducer 2 import system permease protein LsrC n=1 Tax=Labrys monachus TaxID=217067 RepID=A0ABU0FLJ2_9HYPH|nr:ABC transporter permease [Labrys monachus]MDQ0395479.1 rhamnose transport system permease protein [Labrys monachus]
MTAPDPALVPGRAPPRRNLGRLALRLRVSGVVLFLVILGIAFSILTPHFASLQNIGVIASNASILAIVAAAQAIVLLTRNLDVSVGSIMGLTAYLSADYAAHHPDVGVLLVVIALAIGAGLGAVNGLIVAYGRVSPLIATLGTMSLYRGATYVYAHGQEITSSRLPRWVLQTVDLRIGGLPLLVLVCGAVVVAAALFLRLFPFGRRIYAVGSNPLASVFYGLRTERVVLFAYTLAGLMCGFAGLLYAARVGTVTVVLASGWELTSLAGAVLGGVSVAGGSGSLIGAALGAVVLATIDNGLVLLAIPEFWRMFIQGTAIVLAVTADVLINSQIRRSLKGQRFGGKLA